MCHRGSVSIVDDKMEGITLKASFSLEKVTSDRKYREFRLAEVVISICALLNSLGGKLTLLFEDNAVSSADAGSVIRMIEQRLLDNLGSYTYFAKVRMHRCEEIKNQLDFLVGRVDSLFTLDYNLFLPSQTQVIPVSSWEDPRRIKTILSRKICDQFPHSNVSAFVLGQRVGFKESSRIAFKLLKAEKSKCVTFADRMINKSNKFERYISAFANNDGGGIFYGISDDSIVQGEVLEYKDHKEIIRKVEKVFNQMIWSKGKLERGKHWDIQFEPVRDENLNEIPSLFVLVITVAPLPGGLFVQEPECYHVIAGGVEKMCFSDWARRFFGDERALNVFDVVPNFVGRSKWSSTAAQKDYHECTEKLLVFENNGEWSGFTRCTKLLVKKVKHIDTRLLILLETIAFAYKNGHFKRAERKLVEYERHLPFCTKDVDVHTLRAVYVRSAICRAKGDYKQSYDIAREGLQFAESTPAGITTAWFYNHVAMVANILSREMDDLQQRKFLAESEHYFIKALQHVQASDIEQEFSAIVADLQQRVHIQRAIAFLRTDFTTGVRPSGTEGHPNITAAREHLFAFSRIVLNGHPETSLRKTHYLLAMSDVSASQWQVEKEQKQDKTSSGNYETPHLLKKAFDHAKEALKLANRLNFFEIVQYACKRLAVLTEIIIKRKVATLRFPPEDVTSA